MLLTFLQLWAKIEGKGYLNRDGLLAITVAKVTSVCSSSSGHP